MRLVSLGSTIVVGSRDDAMQLSLLASRPSRKGETKPNINIHIVDELPTVSKSRSIRTGKENGIISMLDAVKATANGYDRVLHLKLRTWELYTSSEYAQLSISPLLAKLRQKKLNLVTLKGQLFLADGEVRSSLSSSSSSRSKVGGDVLLDALMRHDTRIISSLTRKEEAPLQSSRRHSNAMNNETQGASAVQHHYTKGLTELNKLESKHREQVQHQLNAQLKKDMCEQQLQFIQDKLNVCDVNPPAAHVDECNASTMSAWRHNTVPDEEMLLQEFNDQYFSQKQKLMKQYDNLVFQYTSSGEISHVSKCPKQ